MHKAELVIKREYISAGGGPVNQEGSRLRESAFVCASMLLDNVDELEDYEMPLTYLYKTQWASRQNVTLRRRSPYT
jgi:hypothetical protein